MSRLFGPMRQVGIVVRDIEKAMRHWVEVCGVGPWFYTAQLYPVAHRLLDIAHDDPDLPHRPEQPAHRLLPSGSKLNTPLGSAARRLAVAAASLIPVENRDRPEWCRHALLAP